MEASRTGVRGERWVTFAAVLFLVVGTFNVIDGIALLVDDNYFRANGLLFGDQSLWGWFAIFMGAGQILIGFGIFSGSILAQIVAVFWAGFNAIPPSPRDRGVPGMVDHHHGDRRPRDLRADHVRTGVQRGLAV